MTYDGAIVYSSNCKTIEENYDRAIKAIAILLGKPELEIRNGLKFRNDIDEIDRRVEYYKVY